MQTIQKTWSGGTVGKLIIGCAGLIILGCLCAIPTAIFGGLVADSGATPTLASRLAEFSTETATPVATNTPPPTATLEPTVTLEPTATPIPTNAPEPAPPTDTPIPPDPTATSVPAAPRTDGAAHVLQIVDGDTIEVEIDGTPYRVRYIGMDTPEQGMPFYDEATQANAALVANQDVWLEKDVSETDQYSRLLRYVYVGDMMVNEELLRSGMAQVATYPPDVRYADRFLAVQQEAQAAGLGLWASQAVATPEPTQPVEPPAQGAANVVIKFIFYDGVVSRVESDEYAEIVNQGGAPADLNGWRLNAGDAGQDFFFPSYVLEPGQACRVYTNESHPESGGFSFGNGQALWNNKGECGYLYDAGGGLVSEYCY